MIEHRKALLLSAIPNFRIVALTQPSEAFSASWDKEVNDGKEINKNPGQFLKCPYSYWLRSGTFAKFPKHNVPNSLNNIPPNPFWPHFS